VLFFMGLPLQALDLWLAQAGKKKAKACLRPAVRKHRGHPRCDGIEPTVVNPSH
jgi:hypothetical protein